jgi:hypothetical protein
MNTLKSRRRRRRSWWSGKRKRRIYESHLNLKCCIHCISNGIYSLIPG